MYKFLKARNQNDFVLKIQKEMVAKGIDSIFFTSPQNIIYSTGYIPVCTFGFGAESGTEMAIINSFGRVKLITSQFAQKGAELQTKGDVEIISYPTYIYIEDYYNQNEKRKDAQPSKNKIFDISHDLINKSVLNPKIGVELSHISASSFEYIKSIYSNATFVDCTELMEKIRSIKFPWEIEVLKYSAQTTEKMMIHTMKHTTEGMTEADMMKVWVKSAYDFTGAHELVGVVQSHTLGNNFWMTALPREIPLIDGDVVRLDGGICIYGYMSDLGRTFSVGRKLDENKKRIFEILLHAREQGLSQIAPGNRISDVFEIMQNSCRKNGLTHYTRGHFGHSIGLGPDEETPMITADNKGIFEPGMVFCLETPYYSSKFNSFNIEDMLVITENGYELFTTTNDSLQEF